jgi:hypothetical protein
MKSAKIPLEAIGFDAIQPYLADAVTRTVHLEDLGQDTRWLKIDESGIVQEAGPFQMWLWSGGRVINHQTLVAGGEIDFQFKGKEPTCLRYRCMGIDAPHDGLSGDPAPPMPDPERLTAYCYASGEIFFGHSTPDGAIAVLEGMPEAVRKAVAEHAVADHAGVGRSGLTWSVPGIVKGGDPGKAETALRAFARRLKALKLKGVQIACSTR